MKSSVWLVLGIVASFQAAAQDYVARAKTTCAPVEGTARIGPCMTDAARSICKSLTLQQQIGCFEDFQRYHLAEAAQIEGERRALKADVERRIERLRLSGSGSTAPATSGHYSPGPNAGRTLDDGLPDIQPSWGPEGDPYAHLRKIDRRKFP